MKNLFLLAALLFCLYLFLYPQAEPAPLPPAPTPAPTLVRRLYYHSPLDAPSMASAASTGTGYHSTDPVSRFGVGPQLGSGTAQANR